MMALLLSFLLVFSAQARNLEAIHRNNDGVSQFKKEKFLDSYESFLSLTAEEPYDQQLQFNLGAALAANAEEEKAVTLYRQLLKNLEKTLAAAKTPEDQQQVLRLKFAVLYNLGVHFQLAKDPDQALNYYQQALELLPESKEIKTNIEMMFSGGGNGKGDKGDKKDKGEGKGEGENSDGDQGDKKDQEKQQGEVDPNKKDEKNSQSMSKEDLQRIMEELKQQEQSIRAKMNRGKGGKDAKSDKEW